MRTDKPDIADAERVVDGNYQPVFVATDVEHHTVLANDPRIGIDTLHISGRSPIRLSRVVIPGAQRLLRVRMPRPELTQRPASDDSHCGTVYRAPTMGASSRVRLHRPTLTMRAEGDLAGTLPWTGLRLSTG